MFKLQVCVKSFNIFFSKNYNSNDDFKYLKLFKNNVWRLRQNLKISQFSHIKFFIVTLILFYITLILFYILIVLNLKIKLINKFIKK